MGSLNEFGWLAKWMLHRITRHRNFKRDPCGALAPCFFLALRSEKVRLAACRLLRDDRLIDYFIGFVCFFE